MRQGVKYSLSDILAAIEENNYKFARIYDGHLPTLLEKDYPVRVLRDCETNEALREKVLDYLKRFPYRFTILFKAHESNTSSNAVLVHYEPSRYEAAIPVNGSAAVQSFDAAHYMVEMEKLRAEMRERDLKREKEEIEEELSHARSVRARYEMLADIILPKILPLFGISPVVMGKAAAQPMQGHDAASVDAKELEDAIDFLVDTFGMQGVIDLAALLKKKPEFINLVKSQI